MEKRKRVFVYREGKVISEAKSFSNDKELTEQLSREAQNKSIPLREMMAKLFHNAPSKGAQLCS